jgi:hypothetical protein
VTLQDVFDDLVERGIQARRDGDGDDIETGLFDMLVSTISEATENEDEARLTQGEAAALIHEHYGQGGIKRAADETHCEYVTLAERCRVVEYYQRLISARQISMRDSIARELMAEFPTLRWSHLRLAKGLSKDNPWLALNALREAVDQSLTPKAFKRHVARRRRANGYVPTKIHIEGRAGYWLTISKRDA